MFAFPYNPEKHRIKEGLPLANWLQKDLKDENIFVYRHELTGNWVVATWLPGKRWREMEDLLIIGKNGPLDFTKEDREKLRYLYFAPADDPLGRLTSARRTTLQEQQDFEDEDREHIKFLARRSHSPNKDHPYFKD